MKVHFTYSDYLRPVCNGHAGILTSHRKPLVTTDPTKVTCKKCQDRCRERTTPTEGN